MLRPQIIRVDASTICQLKCPSCPTAAGEIDAKIGSGFLKFADFKALIEENPYVKWIELTNWGEIFLNPEMLDIMRFSHEKGVDLAAANGVNLNHIRPDVLEGLIKYQFRRIAVSIDGTTQETYEKYRVNGDLARVLSHVDQINEFKRQYNSEYPLLIWQFVIFGHNEHEIEQARAMAKERNMRFMPKLNWEDLYNLPYSPIKDKDLVRSVVGAADREEFQIKNRRHFCYPVCQELWTSPQINYDGEVLGCPVNYWSSFGNAFKENLLEILNGERMNYARAMVQGLVPEREDISCSGCKIYQQMKKHGTFVKDPAQEKQDEAVNQLVKARGYGTF